MEIILHWLAFAIPAFFLIVGGVYVCIQVAVARRLHRGTSEKLRESVVRFDRDRKRGTSMTDHRYDPKQFRRNR